MAFANPVPGWALVLIVVAAAALAWHAYRRFAHWPARRHTLSALRLFTLLALVFILMRPVARSTEIDANDELFALRSRHAQVAGEWVIGCGCWESGNRRWPQKGAANGNPTSSRR